MRQSMIVRNCLQTRLGLRQLTTVVRWTQLNADRDLDQIEKALGDRCELISTNEHGLDRT